ncbi:uncharacterized protein B0H18DRAFT_1210792 [Fomitopsis serialis]|uniref:uncharacterized protein n=1 Tax=Fomitopsis serialis TaxID=139415 RepID=UPI00200808AE|nr:uncharacterized protein B0H18DRAFT_1210792 [Neoantrodia serialis]KAH9926873.1 hypothetical protein B0H18DRAFT_1210792 [Neoantrodia serialis]
MEEDDWITAATSEGIPRCPSIPQLPVEVCGRIIDHVATGVDHKYVSLTSDPHLSTLASCALVCQDWYYLTWYHLRQRIHLRRREDVLSLFKTLRERPRLREAVQQVIISGALPGYRQPIGHMGTFAVMLAGKAPRLSRITITDAKWIAGAVRMVDVGYLSRFSSINTLNIINVTLSSVSLLSRLVSALPRLRELSCINVDCLQKQQVFPGSLPLNCANMEYLGVRWVAPELEDFLVQISRASRVRVLILAVVGESGPPESAASRSQTLLDASSTSADVVGLRFWVDPTPMPDGTIDATVERHYNLSHHDRLWRLEIHLYHPYAAWPWIPYILSRITSKHFQAMSVMLVIRTDHMADDLGEMLTTMEQDSVLGRLDSILQEEHFSSIVVSRGICLGFDTHDDTWTSGTLEPGSALRERWDELARQKMPHSEGRGILTTMHNYQDFIVWREDMERIHRAQATQPNTGGEAQREGQDIESPRGGTD